jgi:hypothetical protein
MAIGRFALYRTANRPRDEDELLAQAKMPAQLRTIGIQGYLTKPYTHESLLRMVDRVLHDLF